jgi:hypothetical protein
MGDKFELPVGLILTTHCFEDLSMIRSRKTSFFFYTHSLLPNERRIVNRKMVAFPMPFPCNMTCRLGFFMPTHQFVG